LQRGADVLTVPRAGQAKLKVTADRRGGFADAVALSVDGPPPGVKATNLNIPEKKNDVEITFAAEAGAKIDAALLTIRGEAKIGGQTVSHTAASPAPFGQTQMDSVRLAVALPTPFKIVGDYDLRLAPRGGPFVRKYRVERNGFDGPIEVGLTDRQARHLQGVTGPTVVVPAGATEFEYRVALPPWMEIGRTSRTCLMGVAVVREGEEDHTVSFSSQAQNDQIIAVVETGRLGLEVEKPAVVVAPGRSVEVPFKVSRGKRLTGPVKVELIAPARVRGLAADPAVVAADQTRGTLILRWGDRAGPLNGRMVIRATIDGPDGAAVAEAKLEVGVEN
jgi:hypothetical protein